MSKKSSPTVIGGFVVGAAVLAVVGILAFGGGRFFREEEEFVMYFERSVRGLDIGAPVVFRGVPIGSVRDIEAYWAPDEKDVRIPVYVTILRRKIKGGGPGGAKSTPEEILQMLIDKWGLRAQLTTDSLVTGKLYVSLDLLPDTPKRLHGEREYPEIPTVPSDFEQFTKRLEKLPISDVVENLNRAIETLNELLESDGVKGIIVSLREGLEELTKVAKKLNAEIEPLAESARGALDQGRNTLSNLDKVVQDDVAKLVKDVDQEVQLLARSVRETMSEAKGSLAKARAILSERSGLGTQIGTVLDELAAAARSFRVLVQYLEEHPEAFIRGKGSP